MKGNYRVTFVDNADDEMVLTDLVSFEDGWLVFTDESKFPTKAFPSARVKSVEYRGNRDK